MCRNEQISKMVEGTSPGVLFVKKLLIWTDRVNLIRINITLKGFRGAAFGKST